MKNIVVFLLLNIALLSCDKTTNEALQANITIEEMEMLNSSTISVDVRISQYGNNPSSWGVCFGLSSEPTIENNVATPINTNGSYSSFNILMEGLMPNTEYFGRGFLTQGSNTDYSLNFSFRTPPAGIGEYKEGGVVFWIDPTDSSHGLVCGSEQISASWGDQNVNITGTNTAIGSGEGNTLILTQDGYYAAADFCSDFTAGGYDDWFLPSIDELEVMYAYRNIINESMIQNTGSYCLGNNYYWSSSQFSTSNAWLFNFGFEGVAETAPKNNGYNAIGIRAY